MAQFVFVYLGGNQPSSPEEARQHFSKYMEWSSSLGEAVVVPTIPLKDSSTKIDGVEIDGVRLH